MAQHPLGKDEEVTPTPEQELILAEAKSDVSLCITALAGAAKTTTLCLLAGKLPMVPTLCCAFNKRIADEMQKRMPGHITCKTMNALGHAAWGQKLGTRLAVDSGKVYDLTKEMMDKLPDKEKKDFGEIFSSVMRGVRLAKSYGYVPDSCLSVGESLCDLDELLDMLSPQIDVEPNEYFQDYMIRILETSIAQAFQGKIDFDDQIYMSTLFGARFPKFPIIMVDEAQDLSSLNHQMLRKMFGGRLIAVGDPFQAIYGFRGAHKNSMDLLKEEFKMKEMYLSVSFRCPRKVVERARFRAPNMQYPDWAKEGHVEGLREWSADQVPDGGAVICRNNAPLFTVALRFIRAGRGIKLVGADIGAGLVKILRKFGDDSLQRDAVLQAVKGWEDDQLAKAREARKASIRDRAECLRVFADFGATLGESIAYAEHLFSAQGPVLFMSGHKSKGLEFPTVFHLDPHLIPSKHALRLSEEGDGSQLEQERNLRYVIETRSMESLYFIHTEDMV
jgi:DNA helicase-2/ATP-dependent DNA helicase PcrA